MKKGKSHRINIAIPENLAKALALIKGDLNVSKICQQALWAEIEWQKSDIQKTLRNVIDRLEEQRQEAIANLELARAQNINRWESTKKTESDLK